MNNYYVKEFKHISGELPPFITMKSGALCSCIENVDIEGYKPSTKKVINRLPKMSKCYFESILCNIAHTLSKGHSRAQVSHCGIAAVYEDHALTLWIEEDKNHIYKIDVNSRNFPAIWEVLYK